MVRPRVRGAKRLGVKRFGGEAVLAGSNVVLSSNAGNNGCGRDHTLFALADGKVKFEVKGPNIKIYQHRS